MRSDEVRGKPFFSLDIGLPLPQLAAPVHGCLHGEQLSDDVTVDAIDRRGRSLRCHVAFSVLAGPKGERRGVILAMDGGEQ